MTDALTKEIGLEPNLVLKAYFQDPDWMFKSAVGGVINASALVIVVLNHDIPIFIPLCFCLWAFNTGYVLRYLRARIVDPSGALPKWNEWQDLFVSGMSWLAVKTAFGIVLFGFTMTSLLILLFIGAQPADNGNNSILFIWTAVTICGIIIIHLFVDFILTLMMVNFAEEENMLSAFAYAKVFRRFAKRPRDFLSAWLLGMGIQWLAIVIPIVTVIGAFFLPSTIFASQLISASILAQAWRSSELE